MSSNEMNKVRWKKKEEITSTLNALQSDLEDYLELWKKTGGGTTGHAIGSMIDGIKKKIIFFEYHC